MMKTSYKLFFKALSNETRFNIMQLLRKDGIDIRMGLAFKRVSKSGGAVNVEYEKDGTIEIVSADVLYLATGIRPNTDGLDCESAGVVLDRRGFVKVDEHMRTSQPNVYAAGDVTGIMPLETVAAKQGKAAAVNMFDNKGETINYSEVPQAVFTSPQVASVGITEDEYSKVHRTCMCSTVQMGHVEKAVAIKEAEGFIKMVLDHKSRKIVGVQIVAPMAADVITSAAYAVRNGMTIYDIRDTVHVFHTLSEMLKKAAQSFDQNLDTLPCCSE